MNSYTPLDAARNIATLVAAVVLTVFHRDVTPYVSAAAALGAGLDLTITTVVKGKGSILHRLEVGVADITQAIEGSAQALPPTAPKTVEHVAAAANAIATAAQTVVAAASPVPVVVTPAPTQTAAEAPVAVVTPPTP